MHLLFLLIIVYIFFWDSDQSQVAFYQVVSSLVLYYDIQDLNKSFPDFGDFLFLHVTPCLLDRLGKGIVLFDVAAVKYFYFGFHGHP